jgi:hypothetical protein
VVGSADRYRAIQAAHPETSGARSIGSDGEAFEVVLLDGGKLQDAVTLLLADRRAVRLNIHLAKDDSYAGHVVRFGIP